MAVEMVVAISIAFALSLFLTHWYRNKDSLISKWPIVGMLPGLVKNSGRLHDFFTDLLRRCGGTFEFKGSLFSSLDFIVTSDPTNVNHILSKNFANYEKGFEFKEIFEPFGEGVFTSDSDQWKTQRKLIHAWLSSTKFALYRDQVVWKKVEKGLIPTFENVATLGIEVDLEDVLQRLDHDIISLFALGFDPNSLSAELPFVPSKDAVADIEQALMYRHILPSSIWKFQKWVQIGEERKLSKAKKVLDEFVYHCISSRREELKRNRSRRQEFDEDLLSYLLVLEDQSGEYSHDKLLRDTAVNLMLAGVSSGLSWFFWAVATNPLVETKILEEIQRNSSLCKDKNMVALTQQELDKFTYLHAALCESLRLYPPPGTRKTAIQPDILPSGHRVGGRSKIFIAIYSMGRMEEIWGQECLEFKPERWISEQGEIIHVPSYKFMAFNSGPRACLGKEMSFLMMKTMVIALLKRYRVEVVEGHRVVPGESVVGIMKNGLKVRIKKRYQY